MNSLIALLYLSVEPDENRLLAILAIEASEEEESPRKRARSSGKEEDSSFDSSGVCITFFLALLWYVNVILTCSLCTVTGSSKY